MKPIQGKWLGIGIVVLGLILYFSGLSDEGERLTLAWFGGVGLLVVIVGFIVYFVYWVCPSCGKMLPGRAWFVEYCHRCGDSIDKPRFNK